MLRAALVLALNLYMVSGYCPLGFIAKGSSCYKFSNDVEEWVNARDICRHFFHAELAEINDEAEDKMLLEMVDTNQKSYWVGHDDIGAEGVWQYASSNKNLTYINWHVGEPNNYQQSEDCMALLNYLGGGWFDAPCSTKLNYICEKPLNPTL